MFANMWSATLFTGAQPLDTRCVHDCLLAGGGLVLCLPLPVTHSLLLPAYTFLTMHIALLLCDQTSDTLPAAAAAAALCVVCCCCLQYDQFRLTPVLAGALGSIFGMMNIFTRASGGMISGELHLQTSTSFHLTAS
jgi:hypothetical protein